MPLTVQAEYPVEKHAAVRWASVEGQALTLDIHVPQTDRARYPVVVVYHGGGWLVNDNAIMDAAAEYLAAHGEYVVANMNFRSLGDNNNTTTPNEMIEDVFGGLLWVKEHIAHYGGDPARIAVTGDSSGGHLVSMLLNAGRRLTSDGFAGGRFGFNPTYRPRGKPPEQIAADDGLRVQAAVVSYGAFDLYERARNGFETDSNPFWEYAGVEPRGLFGPDINVQDNPDDYRAVSPLYHIPEAGDYRLPPQFHHVGDRDEETPPASVKAYVDKLKAAGQPATLKIYPGLNHAYLDAGCNEVLGHCFEDHAPAVLDDMIEFLDAQLK